MTALFLLAGFACVYIIGRSRGWNACRRSMHAEMQTHVVYLKTVAQKHVDDFRALTSEFMVPR